MPAEPVRACPRFVSLPDVDIAYTVKPVWDTYLAFMDQAGADGAFQHEDPRWGCLAGCLAGCITAVCSHVPSCQPACPAPGSMP